MLTDVSITKDQKSNFVGITRLVKHLFASSSWKNMILRCRIISEPFGELT